MTQHIRKKKKIYVFDLFRREESVLKDCLKKTKMNKKKISKNKVPYYHQLFRAHGGKGEVKSYAAKVNQFLATK